jgi:hypothetical protein
VNPLILVAAIILSQSVLLRAHSLSHHLPQAPRNSLR